MMQSALITFHTTDCSVGTYKDTAGNDACSGCPANSVAIDTGTVICDCEANHVRPTPNNADDGCTGEKLGHSSCIGSNGNSGMLPLRW